MRLIEEFMIMANVAAAESLEKARQNLIYRVHEQPSQEKLAAFGDYLKSIGFSFAQWPGDQARGVQSHSRTGERHTA